MAKNHGKGFWSRHDFIPHVFTMGALALAIVAAIFVVKRYFIHPSVDVSGYSVRGIDVSNHNGRINWDVVASDRLIRFVYIKASEGATHVDSSFIRNATGARRAGLAVGAYHFFRKNREGKAQANNFIKAVGNISLDMPWVVDIEDWDNDAGVNDSLVCKRLLDMVALLEEKGHPVMIYTNGNGYQKFYKPHFQGEPLWLCSFKAPNTLFNGHIMQQYSHWGEVAGIDGDVDLNIFLGSEHQWKQWLQRYKQ